ncbi:MAG: 4Fe-4S dicluster domain-containing protein [Desulfovibrio sp.]|jgi:Ni,Fe-hydrogenase III small subunit/formate hydrogenlyase subunit 6/NADH:ubiquinone oxidoreductase subunit I|nr:4Fe-4S dicluster domain-containing protein [Desulfovibrio sp.]
MLEIFLERFRQKSRTAAFPRDLPSLPPRFRGRPFIDTGRCDGVAGRECGFCAAACPLQALLLEDGKPALDMGMCTFCGECARACPKSALVFTTDWRLASTIRKALVVRPAAYQAPERPDAGQTASEGLTSPNSPDNKRRYALPELPLAPVTALDSVFARSFRLRQVTAAGCGACEADLNVLGTLVYDMERFGLDFVASPRHADAIILTGPLPRNIQTALKDCHAAMPAPKVVMAVGACAISGGMFRNISSAAVGSVQGASPHVDVNLFIPGCPPHPWTTLDALLRFIAPHSVSE